MNARRRIAEAQRVEHSDDFGAHAADVAHDSPHSGGRPLDRQHLTRVVVTLVRQHQREIRARLGQRHHSGVFAGSDQNLRGAHRQAPQQMTRGFI